MFVRLLLACSSAASMVLLSGCDVPPAPTASAAAAAVAANTTAVHKRHCVYDTGSRVCRDPDEEADGAALAGSGSPDIQQGRGAVNASGGLH